jgi:predicted DNA-binding transcriptional regulator AlpA
VSLQPRLDALLADPSQVAALPPEAARDLLLQLAPLTEALRLRALAPASANGQPEPSAEDRLLTPEDAARLLSVTPAWLYRRSKSLPFARHLSRKCLRFSEAGLRKWQTAKRA